eukprot:CAMPEP_0202959742 /NCGR_PEP_ID=MMETSP1396-20130829/3916_1 /ASSEMBLY_ACC=CAM_ASM_000872 /TAXON_ID= /ORGANISM="Pseudokeronopsis sp., Strain Brazil" /LENGTH=42 /DNA_ID= /DNA_START= /DNA_END= /DNA_ORIENTATION=
MIMKEGQIEGNIFKALMVSIEQEVGVTEEEYIKTYTIQSMNP